MMIEVPLPDIRLNGKVVIITGADRGLGRIMSLDLARIGATVVLASPNVEALNAVAAEIETRGMGSPFVQFVDITDLASCRALIRSTIEKTGRLDVLVNNARRLQYGPGLPPNGNSLPIHETNPQIYKEAVMVNVVGTFFMSRAAVEYFLGQKKGKIINLTTSIRHFYRRHESPYGVTKAALEASTQIWARDLEGTGVTVNSLLPGGATDTDPNIPKKNGEALLPGDVMNPLLIWLVSDHSDGVTGCRFVREKWDVSLPPDEAAEKAREEPVFQGQSPGIFKVGNSRIT